MTIHQLRTKLSKYGTIQMIKEGYVFTLLLTGADLSNMKRWLEIQNLCLDYLAGRFPVVECMKNEDDFFLIVLKPKQEPNEVSNPT